ncbi:MAG: hypothetical protein HOQ21_10020 [Dermatophilaceae bacterium]|nr:hypothetical protein [Dermatophilaceae bacterium]
MPRDSSSLMTDIDNSTSQLKARELSTWETRRAARTLAHHATDAADLAQLLDMLGLTAAHGKATP